MSPNSTPSHSPAPASSRLRIGRAAPLSLISGVAIWAAVGLTSLTTQAGAETLYVPEGWLYNFNYTGTPQNTAGPGGGRSIDPTAGTTIYGIQDRSPSPQGDDFVVGVYQGTQNWVNYFYAGIPLSSLIHADGTLASLVDGESYTANFWMRGNEVLDALSGKQLGFTFDSNVPIRILDVQGGATTLENYTTSIPFVNDGWTEVALPFTYDSATMSTAALSPSFLRAASDYNYLTDTLIPGELANNRLGSTGFDFVQAAPVPEPASSLMAALTGAFLCLRRSRQRSRN